MPKVKKVAGSHNREIARGINAFSKSAMNDKAGRYRFRNKGGVKKASAVPERKEPALTGKWYPADDIPKPLRRRFKPKTAKLRASITPGTVLIVLSGRFRGKRVVFLKQLPSGLLLVTGPFSVNGVPLRRMNQSFVIATSTKVDTSGVAVPDAVNDAFFARPDSVSSGDAEKLFFDSEIPKPEISAERKAFQKQVDAALLKNLDETMQKYLASRFSLSHGEAPHAMKF